MKPGSSERPDLTLAVVIGAGGLGTVIARRLGIHYRLLIVDIDEARASSVAATLRSEGHDAGSTQCDITDPASVDRLTITASKRGPIRVLAHVAALSPSMGDFRKILQVDLMGAALIEERMRTVCQRGTAAVFISSLAAHVLPADEKLLPILDDPLGEEFIERITIAAGERATSSFAYILAKTGLNRMVRRRASAWGRAGGRITSLSPGLVATPMGALEYAGPAASIKLDLFSKIPAGRECSMLEIADAAEFLVSDRASYINGIDLLVDGGINAALAYPGG